MTRLTDEELAVLDDLRDLPIRGAHVSRAIAELRERRAADLSAEDVRGIDVAIGIIQRRRQHYELYVDPSAAMVTHPATFAVIDELLVFLQAERDRLIAARGGK